MSDAPQTTGSETAELRATAPAVEEPETLQNSAGPAPAQFQAREPEQFTLFGFQAMLTVLVIAIFMITFVVQAFRVPSESMENTLLIGDFVLVDKVHFGTDGRISEWLLPYRPIKRGDIVVFRYPVDPSQYFVKRVVGLPGDRVHLRAGHVFLNGTPIEESYVIHSFPYYNYYRDNFPAPQMITTEVDRKWRRTMRDHLDGVDIVVPADSYFVMGDNRDRSLDSRYWGFVPRGNVIGRPLVIYMSLNDGRDTDKSMSNGKLIHSGQNLAHFLQLARWSRMFRLVR